MLTREQIDAQNDLEPIEFEVPEWDGSVYLIPISATDRARLENVSINDSKADNRKVDQRSMLCAMSIVNAEGKRLYQDNEVAILGKRNARALDRIMDKVMELSGMRQQDFEDAAKNSGAAPTDDSISG